MSSGVGMEIPVEEEFSLWKDPKVRAASIHLIVGIIAFVIGVEPIILWNPRYWLSDELNIIQVILGLVIFLLIAKLSITVKVVSSNSRPWMIRYQPEKKMLDQKLRTSTEKFRKSFNRWRSAEQRAWIYSIILGIFAIFFYVGLAQSAILDEEGYISYTSFYTSLFGLLFVAIWSGCYFLLYTFKRERWCQLLDIRRSHVKYLLEYPKEDYNKMMLKKNSYKI